MGLRQRGLTLLELLVSLTIVTIVTIAAARALSISLGFNERLRSSREVIARRQSFEDGMRALISRAYIDSDTTNPNTYFISGVDAAAVAQTTPGASSSRQSTGQTDLNSLIFTVLGQRVPSIALRSQDDFETLNQKIGPVGGVTEVSFSMTPVGDGSGGKQGLFLREQTPADADATQGGTERLYSGDVTQISFEFFDGLTWETTWSTQTQTTRRLPSAVRVTYRFQDDDVDHIFVVAIPASDVTPDNPVTVTTS